MNTGEYATYFASSKMPLVMTWEAWYMLPVLSKAMVAEMGKKAVFHVFVTENIVSSRIDNAKKCALTVDNGADNPEHDDEGDTGVHLRPPLQIIG